MLLELPKDVLTYLISIVLYDTFVEEYGFIDCLEENVKHITRSDGDFYCAYVDSRMGRAMKRLCLVHPLLRRLLQSATIIYDDRFSSGKLWGFKRDFFQTLITHARRKTIIDDK